VACDGEHLHSAQYPEKETTMIVERELNLTEKKACKLLGHFGKIINLIFIYDINTFRYYFQRCMLSL
jgi:hypothetical protein